MKGIFITVIIDGTDFEGTYTVADESFMMMNTLERGDQTVPLNHHVREHRLTVEHATFGKRELVAETFHDAEFRAHSLFEQLVRDGLRERESS